MVVGMLRMHECLLGKGSDEAEWTEVAKMACQPQGQCFTLDNEAFSETGDEQKSATYGQREGETTLPNSANKALK